VLCPYEEDSRHENFLQRSFNAARTKRATGVDWWPEMHLQQGLEGQVQTELQHPR
jgi:hypothetical protein